MTYEQYKAKSEELIRLYDRLVELDGKGEDITDNELSERIELHCRCTDIEVILDSYR